MSDPTHDPTDPTTPDSAAVGKPAGPATTPTTTGDDAEFRRERGGTSALTDALQTSFRVLRWIILGLVVVFVLQGFFGVDPDEVAVRARFGAITGGDEEGQVLRADGGPYFRFPSPIDEIVFVPTAEQTLELDDAFWYAPARGGPQTYNERVAAQGSDRQFINPRADGALITGDGSLVHGRFTVNWRVRPEEAARFVESFAELGPGEDRRERMMERAAQVVTFAAEQAINRGVATATADDFIRGRAGTGPIREQLQAALDAVDSGITVERVQATETVPPIAAGRVYQDVQAAEIAREQQRTTAGQYRQRELAAAAGRVYEPFALAIDAYEAADSRGDDAARAAALETITRLLDGDPADQAVEPLAAVADDELRQQLADAATADTISGTAADVVNQARAYGGEITSRIEGERENFRARLASYRQAPELTKQSLLREMFGRLLGNDSEKIYVGDGPVTLEVPRDVGIDRRREEAARTQAQEARQREAELAPPPTEALPGQ